MGGVTRLAVFSILFLYFYFYFYFSQAPPERSKALRSGKTYVSFEDFLPSYRHNSFSFLHLSSVARCGYRFSFYFLVNHPLQRG